jgi:hypothetical protein
MQRYTIFFIAVDAVHVSGGFFRPSSGAKTAHTASGICQACLLLLLAWVIWQCQLTHASGRQQKSLTIPGAVCAVPEILMMGGKTA